MRLKSKLGLLLYDPPVRAGFFSFLAAATYFSLLDFSAFTETSICYGFCLFSLLIVVLKYDQYIYTCQGFVIGVVHGLSISLAFYFESVGNAHLVALTRYVFIISFFHISEFVVIALTNRPTLKRDSFLLNHSFEYWMAAVASWTEFAFETRFSPAVHSTSLSQFGFCLCMLGEVIRKTAMMQASGAFTHLVATSRSSSHQLVTTGLYRYMRHPGYVGWFLWSMGTQITLCNPFCFIAYSYVTFQFFNDRIHDEERYLVEFFGQKYIRYQAAVPVGIPFITGFSPY
uniref:Protein-S-isoprenylcysteine O-methyltransferase n=1 Tax=Steinernema glaseri TaxID=37863 RepID=A0A1I7YK18_9BILA